MNRTLATCVQVKVLSESANACYLSVCDTRVHKYLLYLNIFMMQPNVLPLVPYLLNKVRRDRGSLIRNGWSSNREDRWRLSAPGRKVRRRGCG